MFAAGQTAVVAVSGGPDSVALLHCLHTLRETWPISLVAAHLDHGFRGAESAADAEYVRELCKRLNIPCHSAYENVPEQKKRLHLSSQEAARRARHAFLRAVANEVGAARIALGHTRDDRAETILLNIFRGTGPDGLGGFPPIRLPLVRPLYDAARAETVEYCALNELAPRTDPSNESLGYGRNRVRHELLPYLAEHYNPRISAVLLRMSDIVSADNEALADLAERTLLNIQREQDGDHIILSAEAMAGCHLALRRRMLRLAIARVRGDLRGIENDTIDAVVRSAERRERLVIQLPQDGSPPCQISLNYDDLCVARNPRLMELAAWRVELPAEGRVELLGGGVIETRVFVSVEKARVEYRRITQEVPGAGRLQGSGQDALLLSLSDLRLPLTARSWCKGDRMRPRGLNGSKKLQDIFVDRKVPPSRRLHVPVILEAEVSTEADELALNAEASAPGNLCVVQGNSARKAGGRILGLLGVQGGESSLPLAPGTREGEIIGACVLIMALSDTGVT